MLTEHEIELRLAVILWDKLGDSEFWRIEGQCAGREHLLGKDLGADSLDLIEIVMAVEESLQIEIPDKAIDGRFADMTVGDLLNGVARYALAQAA
jgi:acyl carrier protein